MSPTPVPIRTARRAVAGALFVLVLAACAAPGPGGGGPGGGPGNDPVAASLQTLGVDTSATARRAPDGSALDGDDAPLGASAAYGDPAAFTNESAANPTMEFVMARHLNSGDTLTVQEIVGAQVSPGGTIQPGTVETLADLSTGNAWVAPDGTSGNQFQTLRDVAAGDLDGDGFDEIAGLFVDEADGVLKLRTFEDDAAGYAARTSSLASGADVRGVKLVALDDDGDAADELVAFLAYDDRVDLVPLTGSVAGGFSLATSAAIALEPVLTDATLYVRATGGRLDYDGGEELVVVLNEVIAGPGGVATLYVFDDAGHGRAVLEERAVQATVGGVVTAEAADVAADDVDGDGLDEIVLAGATNLATSCNDPFAALMVAFDDAIGGLALLGASVEDLFYQNCPAYASWKRFFVFVATPDLDGDGVHEIAANQLVFENFANAAPFTLMPGVALPGSAFLTSTPDDGQYLSVATMAVLAADVTGDGRENLMVFHQNRTSMPVWGLSAVSTIGPNGNGWAQLAAIPTPGQANSGTVDRPLFVAANVDTDGPILQYGAGSHELVFTEPIVIAALAAPPCHDDIQQNVAACVTRFGQGNSTTVDASLTVTVRASVTTGIEAGVNVPFVGDVGVSLQDTVTASASLWAGAAYTVERTVTYTSGPLEDAVVFATVPYDIYRYAIVSHPDPDLVGKEVVIRVPREPVTMIAERTFFNAALPGGSAGIGANVFDHTPGDVASYPTASRRNTLMSQYGGLDFGPTGVGQGTGDTELEIAVSNEISAGGSLGIEYERTVEATAGVAMAGFSVGYGAEAAFSITSGSQTTYTGVVGSIAAADYAANAYQWGIFTYVGQAGGQRFKVINYWVE